MNALVIAAAVAATNTVTQLSPIIVEASRLDRTTLDLPQAVQVIGAEEIAASGARDIVDVLAKKCPQLSISSVGAANPAARQIAFRGYGENGSGRALILVDGERLNNPDMSAPNLARIDLGSIRSVEVLSGPQNVLHGDMASGGVINIVTDPEGYESHGHAELHGGSWGTIGGSLGYRGGVEDAGVQYWAHGGWDHSDGYRDNSGYNLWNANGGLRWNGANGSYLRASAFYSNGDWDLPRPLSRSQWKHRPRHSVQKDSELPAEGVDGYRQNAHGLNLTGYGVINDENAVRLTFTASHAHTRSWSFGNGGYDDYDWTTYAYLGRMNYVWESLMDYDTFAFRVKPEWINRTAIGGFDNELILGANAGYDRVRVRGDYPTTYYPSYRAPSYVTPSLSKYLLDRRTMAFFGAETFHVTEWLALAAGLRYERVWNRATQAAHPRGIDDLFAYDFAVNVTPIEDFKGYVRFSRLFRNAFLDEISYRGGSVAQETPDPERGWRADVGFEYRFLEDFSVAADAYVSETKKEIFYNPFFVNGAYGWTGDNVNSPSPVWRKGFDAALAWERDKVAGVTLAVSGVDATFDGGQYDGNDVPFVPQLAATLNGRVWLWDDCFVFGGSRYTSAMYSISDFNNEYAKVPDYVVFHLGVTWAPTFVDWLEGWKASVVCDNLFDRNYCDYASYGANYWPAAGRSVMVTLRYEF